LAGCNHFLKQGADIISKVTASALNMCALLARLLKDDRGATAVEYGLIAALIAVAAVTVMGTVGTNLSSTFNTIAGKL
jgi:pilus assembly protein Flp/PilA